MAKRTWKRRLILLALWAALAGAALLALFRYAQHWTPPREEFPVQGLSVSALSGPVVWNMVKAQGVDFVYIRSSSGAKARDAAFATNLEGARAAGMRYGPIHVFNLCDRASDQATLFLSTVPRSEEHTSELQSLMRISYAVFCLKKKKKRTL